MSLSQATLGLRIRKSSTCLNLKVVIFDPCSFDFGFCFNFFFSPRPTTGLSIVLGFSTASSAFLPPRSSLFLEKSFYLWQSLSEKTLQTTSDSQITPLQWGIHRGTLTVPSPAKSPTGFPRHCEWCHWVTASQVFSCPDSHTESERGAWPWYIHSNVSISQGHLEPSPFLFGVKTDLAFTAGGSQVSPAKPRSLCWEPSKPPASRVTWQVLGLGPRSRKARKERKEGNWLENGLKGKGRLLTIQIPGLWWWKEEALPLASMGKRVWSQICLLSAGWLSKVFRSWSTSQWRISSLSSGD